jgi:hypothetical protein
MPFPSSPGAQAPVSGGGGTPSLARSSAAGPSLAAGALRLPGFRGPWTYMISPAKLGVRLGRIVPLPAKAWHEPGLNGNAPVAGNGGEGFIMTLRRQGFVELSHDIPAIAFGQERLPGNVADSTYLQRYTGVDPQGRSTVYWCDAWERPEPFGHLIAWKRDQEGRDAWLHQQLLRVSGGELSELQIRLATEPLIASIRSIYRAHGEKAAHRLREQLKHLPAAHVPPDLKAIAESVGASPSVEAEPA